MMEPDYQDSNSRNIHSQYLEEISQNPMSSQESDKDDSQGFRRISDPIHKFIDLPRSLWRIVDTPQFQRMRFVKQLGATAFVFNGANHTRFEHCLGVGHLAWTYLDRIVKNHSCKYEEMNLKDEAHFEKVKLLVTIAGLCHDLGHGPFSHMFDKMLLPRLNETWEHEQGSCMMLEALLNDPHGQFYSHPIRYKNAIFSPQTDLPIILDMIQGLDEKQYEQKYKDKSLPKWVFDVISNKTTQIDVDKFDYLKRDPSGLNIQHEYDWEMLFQETRIIKGEICYNSKLHDQVYDIFFIRYKLFKQIYLHRVTQGIELMLCDAFEKAVEVYPFTQIIKKPEDYLKLTDSIVERILYKSDEKLKESQELIQRILRRDLYRFVGEVILEQKVEVSNEQIIEGISRHAKNSFGMKGKDTQLTEEERKNVVVLQSKINFCNGDCDPVSKVYFFKSSKPNERKILPTYISSLLRPQKFGERIVRVFVKNNDSHLITKVKSGFANFTYEELRKEQGDYDKKDLLKTPISEKKVKLSPQSNASNSNNSSPFTLKTQNTLSSEPKPSYQKTIF